MTHTQGQRQNSQRDGHLSGPGVGINRQRLQSIYCKCIQRIKSLLRASTCRLSTEKWTLKTEPNRNLRTAKNNNK